MGVHGSSLYLRKKENVFLEFFFVEEYSCAREQSRSICFCSNVRQMSSPVQKDWTNIWVCQNGVKFLLLGSVRERRIFLMFNSKVRNFTFSTESFEHLRQLAMSQTVNVRS
jgi:hypothetical protein